MFKVETKLTWNGPALRSQILARLYPRLIAAITLYREELKHSLEIWGSYAIGGGLARVFKYSAPGTPPFRQTENLYNSIQVHTIEFNADEQMIGECSTDVPYAPTLELGGTLQVDQDTDKPHKTASLINPIPVDRAVTILPRPTWVPTFQRLVRNMLDILRY